jgi:MSHA pilin protein MshC
MMAPSRPARCRGFTLAELVTTIVIMGILAAIVVPRLMSSSSFSSRGFYDEGQAVVRFAQKTAIAWRRSIMVCVSVSEISAIVNADCAAPQALLHAASGAPVKAIAPDGVMLSPVSFSFNAIGRPSGAIIITIPGDPERKILVAAETGYVSRN